MPIVRSRQRYILIIVGLILIGLPTRMNILPLPRDVLKYGGGILWAAMIYVVLGFVFIKAKTRSLWIAALIIAWVNEFAQLYHADWLDDFRATFWGQLTIGRGFLWGDIISYGVGISLAAFIEWRWFAQQSQVQVTDLSTEA